MMNPGLLLVFLFLFLSNQWVHAGTISIGTGSVIEPSIIPSPSVISVGNLNELVNLDGSLGYVHVDGNMYLDYSLFGFGNSLFISQNVSFTAANISIYSYDLMPALPEMTGLKILMNPVGPVSETGNVLMFSDFLITSADFVATGDIYIGNYAALRPVPLPSAIWLFLSGLIGLAAIRRKA